MTSRAEPRGSAHRVALAIGSKAAEADSSRAVNTASPHCRRLCARSCLGLASSPQLHLTPSSITRTAQHFVHPPFVLCSTALAVPPAACLSNTTPSPVVAALQAVLGRHTECSAERPQSGSPNTRLCQSLSHVCLCHDCRNAFISINRAAALKAAYANAELAPCWRMIAFSVSQAYS